MSARTVQFLSAAAAILLAAAPAIALNDDLADPSLAPPPRLAVAWTDDETGVGLVRAMRTRAPWDWLTPPLEVGRHAVLRFAHGRLYVVSRVDDSVTVVDPQTWTVERRWQLEPGSHPLDIAVARPDRAYLTREQATHLLRLNPLTGQTADVVDLSVFGDELAPPDPGMLEIHAGRLFVQIRRFNVPPAWLAVVDLANEQLVQPPSLDPGIQLAGRAPKTKMQFVRQTRRLLVSATGDFFDDGGIEWIDVDALTSLGLVISEYDGQVGADLGAFVMVTPNRGFLTFSTDLLLSSHLNRFNTAGEVIGPELHVSLDYFVPTLVFEPLGNTVFYPDGEWFERGMHAFDARTGDRLTSEATPTSGNPSDITLMNGVTVAPSPTPQIPVSAH